MDWTLQTPDGDAGETLGESRPCSGVFGGWGGRFRIFEDVTTTATFAADYTGP